MVNDAAGFIDFCKKAFGAVETMRMDDKDGKRIMHAHLKIGESELMVADEYPEMGGKSAKTLGGSPVTFNLGVPDADKAAASAVKAGAKITMPVADQFWGDRYGQLEDPYGNSWAVAQPKEKLSQEEMEKRMEKQFAAGKPYPSALPNRIIETGVSPIFTLTT
jgi:uncharacterized glyoxalase superfamily protein PhnB